MQIPAKLQLIGLKLIKAKTNLLHVHNHESRHIFLPGETHRNEITFPTEKINDIWYVKSPGTPREIRMLSSVGFHVKRKIFVDFLYIIHLYVMPSTCNFKILLHTRHFGTELTNFIDRTLYQSSQSTTALSLVVNEVNERLTKENTAKEVRVFLILFRLCPFKI